MGQVFLELLELSCFSSFLCRCEQFVFVGEIVYGFIWLSKGVLGYLNEESLVDFFIYNLMGEIIFRLVFGGNGILKFKGGS